MSSHRRLRSSVVCIHEGKILGFEAVDPISKSSYFFIPGGGIESGETPSEAVVREAMEETGYRIKVDESSELVCEYPFFWNGKRHDCTTYFYLGFLDEPFREAEPVEDADYNKGSRWEPIDYVDQLFAYSKDIKEAVKKLLSRMK